MARPEASDPLGGRAPHRHQAVDAQHEGGAHDRADEARGLPGLVPAADLAQVGGHDRADDPSRTVTMIPPGSRPGMMNLAMAPAMPPMMSVMIRFTAVPPYS